MDIWLFPNKIQALQFLPDTAISKRQDFANDILELLDTGILDHKKIWFSYEANF